MSDATPSLEAIAAELDAVGATLYNTQQMAMAVKVFGILTAIRSHAQKQSEDKAILDWFNTATGQQWIRPELIEGACCFRSAAWAAMGKEGEKRLEQHSISQDDLLHHLQKRGYEVSGMDGDESPAEIVANWFHSQITELREALERSNAAMWDAHYGKGIDVAYAQNVDREVKAALRSESKGGQG